MTEKRNYMDYSLIFVVIFLLAFGLIMVYSASSYEASIKFNDSTYYLRSQLRATILGVVVMIVMAVIDYHLLSKISFLFYLGSLGLIALVMTPLGIERNGARRWLNLGMSLQPSEVAKVALIIFLAVLIVKHQNTVNTFWGMVKMMAVAAVPAGMVLVITRNMSSAIILMGIAFLMLFVAAKRYTPYVVVAVLGVAGAALVVYYVWHLSPAEAAEHFRLARVRAWLEPEEYSSVTSYQTLQALYSIGSGGVFGKGLGQSTQKLGFVPEAQNDMIFSIICEELGLFGAMALIFMFLILIWRFLVVASNAPDLFGSLLVIGVMAHISLQVILNIAVVTNTIPNTGITLPFISYGGSSVVFLLMEIGMVLGVSRRIRFD
ncbi:MAG: putative lipid II flippase FtsW [Lachnospiraceae bacterium]|nr:putative lipid II flippase FtsW [Lachnospiraceae bacterium]